MERDLVSMHQMAIGKPAKGGQESTSVSPAGGTSCDSPREGTLSRKPRAGVPVPGDKFTDEELHDRFGVPMQGGIRVSRDNKCIVLVDLVNSNSNNTCTNVDSGRTVHYMGQNHYGDREGDQVLDGNNHALSRSKEEGYTVLYFTKQGSMLVFDRIVEYDSHRFENEGGEGGRKVIFFKLRVVDAKAPPRRLSVDGGMPGVAENDAAPLGGPDLGMVEAVECVISLHRSYESKDRLLRALPDHIDARSLDRVLEYLVRSGKITIDGGAIRWSFRLGPRGSALSNSKGHDAALANKSILAGTRFEYIEEGKLPTETVGEYIARAYNADEPGTYTAEDARELDESMRRLARGEYHTYEQMRKEWGL